MTRGGTDFCTGICQVAGGGTDFCIGICQVAGGGTDFCIGICQVAGGGTDFCTGICHMTGGVQNFQSASRLQWANAEQIEGAGPEGPEGAVGMRGEHDAAVGKAADVVGGVGFEEAEMGA